MSEPAHPFPIGYPFVREVIGDPTRPGQEVLVVSRFRPPPDLEGLDAYRDAHAEEGERKGFSTPLGVPAWLRRDVRPGTAISEAWAVVRAYGVPHYDTTRLHPDFRYIGYGSGGIASLLASIGLRPATDTQLVRTMAEWEAKRAFPRPGMPPIVALGCRFGTRHRVRWLSCGLDRRRVPRFELVPDAEPDGLSERPYWPWQATFLAVPPGAP